MLVKNRTRAIAAISGASFVSLSALEVDEPAVPAWRFGFIAEQWNCRISIYVLCVEMTSL